MSEKFVFTTQGLNKRYGARHVLKDISLSFFVGAKIGIVGPNGAGKSTLLRIMAGVDTEYDGTARLLPGYRVGYVPQEPSFDPQATVREVLQSAFGEVHQRIAEYESLAAKMGEDISSEEMERVLQRMGQLQDEIEARDGWNLELQMKTAAEALCLPDDERTMGTLSGGEKRRVALCKVLLEKPDLLLLDEPTNHLDAETIDWLEIQLREYPGTVILVTHDRYFLDNVTEWILELDNGFGVPWKGSYSVWIEQKLAKLAQESDKDSPRARMLQKELAWIRMSNKDRRAVSEARLRDYSRLLAEEAAAQRGEDTVLLFAPPPPLGDTVVRFENVSKSYEGECIFSDVSFDVPRGAVVGIVGPNGTGKTTLLRVIAGLETPDQGTVIRGESVRFAYADQERSALQGSNTLVEEIGEGNDEILLGTRRIPVRKYLALFGFRGNDQQKSVNQLSGGERNRANLAKVFKIGGNVILLDEPTNDLDVNTLRMLEDAIERFAGNLFVVSHDRFFLDRTCTHLLVFEGEGKVRFFQGNYREYEEWRQKEFGSGLFEDRRARYRRLVLP